MCIFAVSLINIYFVRLCQRLLKDFYPHKNRKFAIVVSRWNQFIVSKMLDGTLDALKRNSANDDDITIAYCPGAFEIPLTAKKLAETKKYDAVIALGAVIRGATPHFDYISAEVTKGLAATSLETGVPCVFRCTYYRFYRTSN